MTCGAASLSHQPQQHSAGAALGLQHLQGAHLQLIVAVEEDEVGGVDMQVKKDRQLLCRSPTEHTH